MYCRINMVLARHAPVVTRRVCIARPGCRKNGRLQQVLRTFFIVPHVITINIICLKPSPFYIGVVSRRSGPGHYQFMWWRSHRSQPIRGSADSPTHKVCFTLPCGVVCLQTNSLDSLWTLHLRNWVWLRLLSLMPW
jgi:hypothetical protein